MAGDPVQLRLRVLLGLPVVPGRGTAGAAALDPDRSLRAASDAEIGVWGSRCSRTCLFFCHIIVLGFASLIAFGYVAGSNTANPKASGAAIAAVRGSPAAARSVVLRHRISSESSVQDGLTVYGFVSERFAQLLVQPAGHESPQGLLTPLITAAVVLLPLLAGLLVQPQAGALAALRARICWSSCSRRATCSPPPTSSIVSEYSWCRSGCMIWDPPQSSGRRLDWAGHRHRAVVVVHDHRPLRGVRGRDGELPRRRGCRSSRAAGSARWCTRTPVRTSRCRSTCISRRGMQATGRGIVDFNFADFYLAAGPLSQGCRSSA